jgi:hypothetical protein
VSTEKIRANISRLVDFNNRTTISSNDTDLKPGTGIIAASEWIKSQFDAYSQACGGCLEVKFDAFIQPPLTGRGSRVTKPTPLRNVYAILRGTDPAQNKRIYLVTGHYDTRETDTSNTHDPAPGANDDTSGTAVSMEAARILSQYKFPATIVFVTVAGEEQGLLGAAHLAQLAKDEGWQLEGVLNNDIVGGDTTPGETLQSKSLVRVFSQGILPSMPIEDIRQILSTGSENDTPPRELAREVLEVGRTYFPAPSFTGLGFESSSASSKKDGLTPFRPVMELRLDRFLRGGDHRAFSDLGFASVRFTEWRENFNHQHQHVRVENGVEYGDLLKFDDFNYIGQVARLNMATLATLALSPGIPTNVRVVTTNLDNSTTLKWDPPVSAGTDVHYQVVWRPTSETDWHYGMEATGAAGSGPKQVTLQVSKDDVFFGVRACDTHGHCSQAVAPTPEARAR